MSKSNIVPNELINNILTRLENKDLLQCSLTCRQWKTVSHLILFEKLPQLTDQQMNILLKALSVYQGDHFKNSPGNMVRYLDCSALSDNFDIESLDKLFPFVQNITFKKVQFIQKHPLEKYQLTFYDKLHGLILNGKFPNLKSIPYLHLDGFYLKLILSRKDDITELNLEETDLDTVTYDVFDNLHHFPKLKSLKLDNTRRASTDFIENLLPNGHPTLESINFNYQYYSVITISTAGLDINNIQPLLNVKKVHIRNHRLLYGGDKSYLYIMKKFPNVQQLHLCKKDRLKTEKALHKHDYTAPSVSCLSQFLLYLLNKKKVSVSPIITDQFTTEIVDKYLNHIMQFHRFNNNVEIHLNISFDMVTAKEEDKYSQERTAYIKIDHEYRGAIKLCKLQVMYKSSGDNICEPYLELLQKIRGYKIEYLTIGDTKWDDEPVFLNTIFDYCTNLKTLHLEKRNNVNFFEEETNLENMLPSKLEHLRFSWCEVSQDMIYPKIARRCPNLKSLELFNFDKFSSSVHPLSQTTMAHYTYFSMKSTRLEKLHFRFSVKYGYVRNDYDYLSFRLKTANKKTRYCHVHIFDAITERFRLSNNCTEDKYNMALEDDSTLVIDIYCEAVKEFIVEFDDVNENEMSEKIIYKEEDFYVA